MIIAHRLGGVNWEENSRLALRRTLESGSADGFECDVWRSKDGELVVCHDSTTGRVAEKDLSIRNSTLAELRQAGFHAQGGPLTLRDLLGEMLAHEKREGATGAAGKGAVGKTLIVEFKIFDSRAIHTLREQVEELGFPPERLIASSFSPNVVRAVKEHTPFRACWNAGFDADPLVIHRRGIFLGPQEVFKRGKECGADILAIQADREDGVYIPLLAGALDNGFQLMCGSISDPVRAQQLMDLGASVLTDYPEQLRQALQAQSGRPTPPLLPDGDKKLFRPKISKSYTHGRTGPVALAGAIVKARDVIING